MAILARISTISYRKCTKICSYRKGNTLVERIRITHNALYELQEQSDREILQNVNKVNQLASEIRDLNEEISKLETLGDQPNDLKDKRDLALEELSKLVDINVERRDKDEVIVFIGSETLVQGEIRRELTTRPMQELGKQALHEVVWKHNDRKLILQGGQLSGLIEMRDEILRNHLDAINAFALNLSDMVNEIHKTGLGLDSKTNLNFF